MTAGAAVKLRSAKFTVFLCLFLLLSAFPPHAFALDPALDVSQYAHTAWRIREGFTKSQINALAQTPDGFLWLGTEAGLWRFDGVRATLWHGEPLIDSLVRVLFVARDGALWIGTERGLARWKDGQLVTYRQLERWIIDGIAQDREGTIWVGAGPARVGFLCAILSHGIECYGKDGRFGGFVGALQEDRDGDLWVVAANGVWRWKPGPPRLHAMRPAGGLQLLSEAPSGGILVLTNEGVRQIINDEIKEFSIPGVRRAFQLSCVLRDRDGAVWIGTTDRGLIHVHDGRSDMFGIADGLSSDFVQNLFEDQEGNIWAATLDGLDGFHALPAATYSTRQGVVAGWVGAILADEDGGVWFGARTGLYRWRDGHITVHRGRLGPPGVSPPSSGAVDELPLAELPEAPVGSLFQDHLGRIWLGARKSLGYVENKRFNTVVGVPGGYIDSLTEDKKGNLWIAHREAGLLRLSADLKVRQFPWTMISRSDDAVDWRLATDPVGGGLWIGSTAGGVVYFMDGQVRASFGVGAGLGKGSVNDLRAATDGTVWAATDGGLSRLKAGHIATVDSRSGLPCDAVDSSLDDGEGSTWLYTHCGLVRIGSLDLDAQADALEQRKTGKGKLRMLVLNDSDGIPSFGLASSWSPHMVRSKDGKLWLITRDGVAVVDPHHLHFNEVRPPVHVEQVIADGHTYQASSRLKLPPRPRDVEIKYTALSLAAPEKVRFRYKLEGRDQDWRDAGNGRGAIYSDLPPGNYRFRVIASNNSGVWNEQGDTLDFSIAPAYWQTIWFRTLCVLAFLGLLWMLYQLRLRQVTRAFELGLEARVAERTRIARELHDTLLQGFHGVLLRFQTAARLLPTRPAEARQVLESTLDQAEQALADGRNAVQGLRSSVVEAPELADAIKTLGEELAADPARDRFIPLSLRVEGTPRKLRAIVRDEIYRIAGEALRNAFRHSGATRIEVELQYDVRHFELRVRDDGKGIDAKFLSEEGRGKHFGLSGMRERAEMIGGTLTLWTSPNSGTELELKIPGLRAYRASPRRGSWLLERLSTVGGEREP